MQHMAHFLVRADLVEHLYSSGWPAIVETEGTHSAGFIGSDFEKALIQQTPAGIYRVDADLLWTKLLCDHTGDGVERTLRPPKMRSGSPANSSSPAGAYANSSFPWPTADSDVAVGSTPTPLHT